MAVINDGVREAVSGGVGTTVEISEMEAIAKGAIIVGDGSGAPSLESIGVDGAVLTCDSVATRGVSWSKDPSFDSLDVSGDVGIGTASPNVKLEVVGTPGASVGGFPSGALHVRSPSALVNANAVITGHNSNGGNKQLWYLGSTSSSNDDIALINRQNARLQLNTNGANRLTVTAAGDVGIGTTAPGAKLEVAGQVKITGGSPENGKYLRSDADGLATWGDVGWTDLGTDVVLLNSGDNVGIGTATPTEKLDVNGNIKADIIIDKTTYAQLSSSVNQEPSDTNPTVITYNTQDAISGLTHSTSVNPGEITIDTAGIYFVSPQPQIGKTSGGTKVVCDMFLQVDRGSGFVDEANSNIKLSIKDADITDSIVAAFTISFAVGDKIRVMQVVSSSVVGMGLKNTDPVVGPPTMPRTPSIIFTMYRVGGIP